jgi:hypothetical protein
MENFHIVSIEVSAMSGTFDEVARENGVRLSREARQGGDRSSGPPSFARSAICWPSSVVTITGNLDIPTRQTANKLYQGATQ